MPVGAAEALERETTVPGLLKALCVELTRELDAGGCNLSRVIGQLLVDLAEHAPDGRQIQLGRGYLIPDYPVTAQVIETREPRAVSLLDEDPDPYEAALLEELGFDSLLMVPLVVGPLAWGLLEIYGSDGRVFTREDAARAVTISELAARVLERLQAEL